ncbi:extracellular solute-binding protein [Cellulomonas hominis]|uniref:sugar ABC transporter substrate-binding protein n=1 Tax=Cellulomonas hominis TaxID=156981 RepID=UPI001C122F9B|nr:extracellular solute-binding protein [Cellulomonas hominis]MBU5421767.1 extracellular solute-binding protein [Cellulomonas hominis]
MRKTRKVRAAAALLGAATVAALAACSSGSASGEGTGDGTTTLTVWHYYNTDGQVEGLEKLATAFEADHPDVDVQFQYVPVEQMTTKAVTAAGAQTGPDVLVFGASGTYPLAQSGAIEPMDDWWSGFADAAQFPDGVLQKVDGELYGVQGYVNLLGLWYNQDLLDELGAQVPTTVAELEDVMAQAVAAGKQGITLTGKPGLESQWQGFPWFTSDGFTYADPQADAMATTYAMLQDWITRGYLSQEAATWDQAVPFQQFAAGSSAFAVNGNWQIAAAAEADFAYGVAPLPLTADGGVLLGGEVQNVGAFSKNPDLAREFLEDSFFSVDGQLTLLDAFGSIPARADAAVSSQISDDPVLSVFGSIVQDQGRPSPSPEVPSASVDKVETLVGDYWSKAISGQGAPEDLASQLVEQLTPLLQD